MLANLKRCECEANGEWGPQSVCRGEALLLHELAHIRRHDYLIDLVQMFVDGWLFLLGATADGRRAWCRVAATKLTTVPQKRPLGAGT